MKPHYRLHCNFGDAKPLWWVTMPGYYGDTDGFSTPKAALFRASVKTWVQIAL